MESIIIGPDRIKLMLSGEELKTYGLCQGKDIDSCLTGTVLRKILRDAGFDTALARLHVQVYDSGDNGCEMYVALLPEELTDDEGSEAAAIVIERMEDLRALVSRLMCVGYGEDISIYKDGCRHYVLFESALPDFAGDYGRIEGSEKIPFVLEYATPVCIKTKADGTKDCL